MLNPRLASAAPFAAALLVAAVPSNSADAAVVVTARNSNAGFDVLAGAGGATSRTRQSAAADTVGGVFAFSRSATEAVTEADPFSGGSATANGSLTVTDDVASNGDEGFTITASRVAGGTNVYGSGVGFGTSELTYNASYSFSVDAGETVPWSLVGSVNPGGSASVNLRVTAGPSEFMSDGGAFAESGVLSGGTTGRSYSFQIQSRDFFRANSGTPIAGQQSSLDATLTVGVVPEPGSLALAAGLGGLLLRRRTRRA